MFCPSKKYHNTVCQNELLLKTILLANQNSELMINNASLFLLFLLVQPISAEQTLPNKHLTGCSCLMFRKHVSELTMPRRRVSVS